MFQTTKKECPKCSSKNVYDRKDKVKVPKDKEWHSIYKCKDCDEFFILINNKK